MVTKDLSFLEHLEELRKRVLIALVSVGVCAAAAYAVSEQLLALALRPLGDHPVFFFSPQEAFLVRIQVALLAGLVAASPVVFAQFWLFISPGLYPQERKAVAPLIAATTLFFLTGASFCLFVVMPAALQFLLSMGTDFLRPMLSIRDYLSFLTTMTLAFGIAFNLPVVALALVAFRMLTPGALARAQRHAILVIFIAAAVLTPGPDVASQLLLAVPLVALFELSVLLSWFAASRRTRTNPSSGGLAVRKPSPNNASAR